MIFELISATWIAVFEVLKWYFLGALLTFGFFMYVIIDMFGAPHPRKKFPWEFWRSR